MKNNIVFFSFFDQKIKNKKHSSGRIFKFSAEASKIHLSDSISASAKKNCHAGTRVLASSIDFRLCVFFIMRGIFNGHQYWQMNPAHTNISAIIVPFFIPSELFSKIEGRYWRTGQNLLRLPTVPRIAAKNFGRSRNRSCSRSAVGRNGSSRRYFSKKKNQSKTQANFISIVFSEQKQNGILLRKETTSKTRCTSVLWYLWVPNVGQREIQNVLLKRKIMFIDSWNN